MGWAVHSHRAREEWKEEEMEGSAMEDSAHWRHEVLVTENVEIDLDMTNGAWGTIVDIVMHSDKPPLSDEPIVHLKYPPWSIIPACEAQLHAHIKIGRIRWHNHSCGGCKFKHA
jgi:hypothetical protein